MDKVIKFDKKKQKIKNNGIYVYEKIGENKYTVVKILGEYEDLGEATDTLMKIMSDTVSEDELTKILKEKRQKM